MDPEMIIRGIVLSATGIVILMTRNIWIRFFTAFDEIFYRRGLKINFLDSKTMKKIATIVVAYIFGLLPLILGLFFMVLGIFNINILK